MPAHQLQQVVHVEWLPDAGGSLHLHRGLGAFVCASSGHDDDRRGWAGKPTVSVGELSPARARQAQIQHDEVGGPPFDQLERGGHGRGRHRLIPLVGQEGTDEHAGIGVIL